jgi:hypothetical protein
MTSYIITEEQLNRAYGLRHAIYSNIFSDLLDEVHSHTTYKQSVIRCWILVNWGIREQLVIILMSVPIVTNIMQNSGRKARMVSRG